MSPIRRFALIVLPLLAGLAGLAPVARAQSPGSARFAFADTTLLRDTLGLHFDGLFQTADSLRMLPDSLRAQVIRFRLPIRRLLVMADSMGVPVDSVGSVILRERFNPLAAGDGGEARTAFKYTSGYAIGKNNTAWGNGADYSMTRGRMILRNGTNITMDRNVADGQSTLQQTRDSRSEANWRPNPNLSIGGRAVLYRFDTLAPLGDATRTFVRSNERKNEFQFSSTARPQTDKQLSSDFKLLFGYLDDDRSNLPARGEHTLKRGVSGDFNGRVRLLRGKWLSHDLNGGVDGNRSRTRDLALGTTLPTLDYSQRLRGALLLYQAAPVGFNLNYSVLRTHFEGLAEVRGDSVGVDSASNPQKPQIIYATKTIVRPLLTSAANVDATVRMRLTNDRYLNLSANKGRNATLTGTSLDKGVRAQGRWAQGAWALDSEYADLISDQPARTAANVRQVQDNRQSNATLSRPFGRRITTKLGTSVSLSQYRNSDSSVPRDSYRQSYRIDAGYIRSERLTSGVALDVSLAREIALLAGETSGNSDRRSYRAEWRWSYRMLRGLTASQNNTVTADYTFKPFATESDKLSLTFNSVTNLAAVLTPRLTIDVSHNVSQQPKGDWLVNPDGPGALSLGSDDLNYVLRSRITWSPTPAMSFSVTPEYTAAEKNVTSGGVEALRSRTLGLNVGGLANLNLAVSQRGLLTGSIGRSFTSSRTRQFSNGLPQVSPLSERDFWSGSLQFSWEL